MYLAEVISTHDNCKLDTNSVEISLHGNRAENYPLSQGMAYQQNAAAVILKACWMNVQITCRTDLDKVDTGVARPEGQATQAEVRVADDNVWVTLATTTYVKRHMAQNTIRY